MPPPKQLNLVKRHMMLDKHDLATLESVFGSTIGVSKAVRIAIRKFLTEHEALARQIIDKTTTTTNLTTNLTTTDKEL